MTTMIKFCGLKTKEAIDLAALLGAWKIGFIFFEKSPRNVSLDDAAILARHADKLGLATVAVTVDADDAYLDSIVSIVRPTKLQLHGDETPDRLFHVKSRYELPVMKAISVREPDDVAKADAYGAAADYILFDAKPPKGSALPGGNGTSFDWTLLDGLSERMDYVLSGGLNADNVDEALRATDAGFIDVSSGIESAPGVKDAARMRAFAEAVRHYDAAKLQAGT